MKHPWSGQEVVFDVWCTLCQ